MSSDAPSWFLAGAVAFTLGAIAGFVWALWREYPVMDFVDDPLPPPPPSPPLWPDDEFSKWEEEVTHD
jgi:hypothetical protein